MVSAINTSLGKGWKANKITPSHCIDDHEFIRRASLDIIGRIATPGEIRAYMKYPQDKRRSMLIERLLKSEDYPRHWANLWSNWLLTRSGEFGRGKYHDAMTVWLEDQFFGEGKQSRRPRHQVALTATGKNSDGTVPGFADAGETERNAPPIFILAHLGEPVPRHKQRDEWAALRDDFR